MHNRVKFFLFLNLSYQFVYGTETFKQDNYVEIVAKNLDLNNSIIKANGNVILYSPKYYMTADSIIYDQNSTDLELKGDVNIINNRQSLHTKYAKLNIKDKSDSFDSLFIAQNDDIIWFKTLDSNFTNNTYSLQDGSLSSCDCDDPDWHIGFRRGDYNLTKKWVNTYDTTLYIKDTPVLYTPYFGFPTSRTRQTGFLRPTLGWSSDDGILYAQPFYYAPKVNYDIELIPQIRVKRGYGSSLKYRYVDSLYSSFHFETSYFKEYDDYFKANSLENQEHYGWKFEYKRDKLFSKDENSDGLLLQSIDMNDVDYINTQYDNDNMNYTNKLLESKLKYFYNTNSYYSDIEVRLYKNISQDNSDDVAQNIPSLSYYKYSNRLLNSYFTYSTNIDFSRNTKKVDLGSNITNITLPIKYSHKFLYDYLDFSFIEKLYFKNINYNDNRYENLQYATYDHIFNIGTNLIKPYDNYIHTVKFDLEILEANIYGKKGYDDTEISDIDDPDDTISIMFNQSLYSSDTLDEIINHTLKQSYVYDQQKHSYQKDNLENFVKLNYYNGSISNSLIYNYDRKKIVSSSTSLKYDDDQFFTNIYHSYIDNADDLTQNRSITYDAGLNFSKFYTISYKEEYDLLNKISKKKEYLFKIKQKCWDLDLRLTDSLVATNRVDNGVLRQNIIYLQFNLKKLFKLKQYYKFKEEVE